jgi:hypothetical protein
LAEAGRPQYSTPLAADDMIGSLATRVRELSLRVAQLEGELEAARRRVAVYEDFDAQVQDSLSAALRASNQIRERARVSAEAIAEEARAQRPSTVAELDAMRIERDALRRAIDGAGSGSRGASSAATIPMAEMRTAATEALRGVFKELVAEIRSMPQEASRPAPAPAPAAVQTPAAAPARPANSPSAYASPPVSQMPAAQQPAAPAPPPASNITAAQPYEAPRMPAAPPAPAPQQQAQPYSPPPAPPAPAPSYSAPESSVFSRPTIVPQRERAEVVEDVDVAPAPPTPARAPAMAAPVMPAPVPAAPVTQQQAPAPAPAAAPAAAPEPGPSSTEPVGEIQIVLSPISSFPRLVELERRLQGMPVVRTVYARDFRNGVATLAIGLRHPMTVDEFAGSVTKLDYPRLRIISTSGYVLELRIDTEASSIA